MATRLMTWRRRGLLFAIGAAFVLTAVPATAQTDGYGPSVSTDREDQLALLGLSWGSDAFYKYMIEDASTLRLSPQTDVYGPSVSTDREDQLALLGLSWGSEAFYEYMIEDASSPQPSLDTSWANGVVDDEPWLGN